ncbi:NUDIX domain-containing protein [Halodurantibacterium flavum]
MTDPALAAFRPLHFDGLQDPPGAVPVPVAGALCARGLLREAGLRLELAPGDPTARLEEIRDDLYSHGLIEPPRAEVMPVTRGPEGAELARIDRSALRIMGFWAQKVHINGLTLAEGGPMVWLSLRSHEAAANPGRWDTLVAGGRAAGQSVIDCALQEGWQEAGLRPEEMRGLRAAGRMSVQYVSARGFHQELLLIHHLDLPPGFQPQCHDGEIEQSEAVPLGFLRAMLADPGHFKFSSWLVLQDLVARLDPDDPDTDALGPRVFGSPGVGAEA